MPQHHNSLSNISLMVKHSGFISDQRRTFNCTDTVVDMRMLRWVVSPSGLLFLSLNLNMVLTHGIAGSYMMTFYCLVILQGRRICNLIFKYLCSSQSPISAFLLTVNYSHPIPPPNNGHINVNYFYFMIK